MPCPFCMIAGGIPPSPNPAILRSQYGSAYPILSTPIVIAFLDIAPLSRGHVLLCPRRHCAKSTEMTVAESAVLGVWLPILTRAVLKVVAPEGSTETASWNVIQANGKCFSSLLPRFSEIDIQAGAEAGQTVPHSHFHIIPRLGEARDPSDISDAEKKTLPLEKDQGRSWPMMRVLNYQNSSKLNLRRRSRNCKKLVMLSTLKKSYICK
jgi:diadenosine tetraphosphate (Ap4A) HIT family hydrolase